HQHGREGEGAQHPADGAVADADGAGVEGQDRQEQEKGQEKGEGAEPQQAQRRGQAPRNSVSSRWNAAGCSPGTVWPAPGTSTRRACGFVASIRLAVSGASTSDSAPRTMSVGQVIALQSGERSTRPSIESPTREKCPSPTASMRAARSPAIVVTV